MEIAAYGPADAEATVEKELRRALPEGSIDVRAIRRLDPESRIVETFGIEYRLQIEVTAEGDDEKAARRAAFALARTKLEATRFSRIAWDRADVKNG